MAKSFSSAIGVDLGQHNLKGVLLQRKGGNRYHITGYAIRQTGPGPVPADKLAHHLKLLMQDIGGSAKGYAAAVVVSAFERESAYQIDGVTVVPCPHQTRGVTCRECGLCRDDERMLSAGVVIAFQAHSSGAPSIRKTLLSLPIV